MECLRCGSRIRPSQLHQVCRRYRLGRMVDERFRCGAHFLVYDLAWTWERGWHRGAVDRRTYLGGTEDYGQGYAWAGLPNGAILGASSCKSCGRFLDFAADPVQMSVLVRGRAILDVLFQCPRHW